MAKQAFDHCSRDYASYRPSYPDGVLQALGAAVQPAGDARVADIGAGTGILTGLLAKRGLRVVAVDPSESMVRQMQCASGANVRRACATAEHTALASGSVDLVTCGQSFHWFNPPVALAEFARILRPDGVLALVWNNRDTRDLFVQAFEALITRWNQSYACEYRRQDWPAKVAAANLFTSLELRRYESLWHMPQEAFVGFTRSVSYIRNVLAREDLPRFEGELRKLMSRHFAAGECIVPLVTELWMCRRRPAGSAHDVTGRTP